MRKELSESEFYFLKFGDEEDHELDDPILLLNGVGYTVASMGK